MLVIVGARTQTAVAGGGPNAYYPPACGIFAIHGSHALNPNHHSPHRQLIALRIDHADLDALIDRSVSQCRPDELVLRRLKKHRLALCDAMDRLARDLVPPEPA
ncbi:YdcH family protein [Acidovorax sp. LjRoot129]|uniref:YdcH family protein n=1 Tax=Acidovorax sp. LjRoot129 TaxID=3342260 RepID=UPI003F5004D5